MTDYEKRSLDILGDILHEIRWITIFIKIGVFIIGVITAIVLLCVLMLAIQ